MKFILNVAVDPHFCAFFDDNDRLIEKHEWMVNRRDGAEVFDFLERNNVSKQDITFIGGVSGPGGFSSLRAGAGILNSLSFAKDLPIHQVRADVWVAEFLQLKEENSDHFLLNSFSDGVFYLEKGKLQRIKIDEAVTKFENQKMFVFLLPSEKRDRFPQKINLSFENSEKVLLEVLKKQKPKKTFIPDYEFPPV